MGIIGETNTSGADSAGLFLLIDAAGPLVQTALWSDGAWFRWIGSREVAGRSVFAGVQEIFKSERISLKNLSGFFFCEGPGSMLGVRIAAMAIRGWQTMLDAPLPIFEIGRASCRDREY